MRTRASWGSWMLPKTELKKTASKGPWMVANEVHFGVNDVLSKAELKWAVGQGELAEWRMASEWQR